MKSVDLKVSFELFFRSFRTVLSYRPKNTVLATAFEVVRVVGSGQGDLGSLFMFMKLDSNGTTIEIECHSLIMHYHSLTSFSSVLRTNRVFQ